MPLRLLHGQREGCLLQKGPPRSQSRERGSASSTHQEGLWTCTVIFFARQTLHLVQARSFRQFLAWLGTKSFGHLAWSPSSACKKTKVGTGKPSAEGCGLPRADRVAQPAPSCLCSGALSCTKKEVCWVGWKRWRSRHVPGSVSWGTRQEEGRHGLNILLE